MLEKLHPRLRDIVKDKRWPDFTEIQKAAFDPIYNGEHCLIEAPTSGGKTEAVFFPLITKIVLDKSPGVKVLYVAPLKALLNDIELRAGEYASACNLEAFKWHGDVSQSEKIKAMAMQCEILLTTTESLEAILLRKGNWNQWFNHLHSVVIDEAHSFAQSDRGSHLLSLLERLEHEIDSTPQRIAVTATIGNPDDMLQWLLGKKYKKGRKIIVKSKRQKEKDFKISFFDKERIGTSLDQVLYNLLLKKKSLVFRNSRSDTEDSAKYINEKNKRRNTPFPLNVRTHHSSVSKYLREDAEMLLKARTESALNAIISTSTLELGIDIGHLDQVVQVGEVSSSGAFLQRVGRTGRREDRPQFFRGLCNEEEALSLLAACVNLGLKGVSENILFPHKAFHILAHQTICLCLQKMGIRSEQIWEILSGADCFRDISQHAFEQLIRFMIDKEYLRKVEHELLVVGDATEKAFLAANWKRLFAVFDTGPMYNVLDGKNIVGTLDTSFVSMQEVPFIFMLGGIEWKAVKINHESQQVAAEKNFTGNIPKWQVFNAQDVPFETAQEVGRLLTGNLKPEFLDATSITALSRVRDEYEYCGWNENQWGFETSEGASIKIYSFCGDKINRTLAQLLQKQLSGVKVSSDYKVVEVKVKDGGTLKKHTILQFLKELKNTDKSALSMLLQTEMKRVWFSKFTSCLPDELAKKTIIERALDIGGMLREVSKIS